jgi:hypothetical protein
MRGNNAIVSIGSPFKPVDLALFSVRFPSYAGRRPGIGPAMIVFSCEPGRIFFSFANLL